LLAVSRACVPESQEPFLKHAKGARGQGRQDWLMKNFFQEKAMKI
jgi:hypothetical protein